MGNSHTPANEKQGISAYETQRLSSHSLANEKQGLSAYKTQQLSSQWDTATA